MSLRLRREARNSRFTFNFNIVLRLTEKRFDNKKAQQASEFAESHYSVNFEGEFVKSNWVNSLKSIGLPITPLHPTSKAISCKSFG